MALSLDDSVELVPDLICRELDGEAVILNLATGIYFGLDPVGCRAWQLIEQHQCLQPVFATMCAEYDVPPETLEADLLRLVGDLCSAGLTRVP